MPALGEDCEKPGCSMMDESYRNLFLDSTCATAAGRGARSLQQQWQQQALLAATSAAPASTHPAHGGVVLQVGATEARQVRLGDAALVAQPPPRAQDLGCGVRHVREVGVVHGVGLCAGGCEGGQAR